VRALIGRKTRPGDEWTFDSFWKPEWRRVAGPVTGLRKNKTHLMRHERIAVWRRKIWVASSITYPEQIDHAGPCL
jgi:hypothetical protein